MSDQPPSAAPPPKPNFWYDLLSCYHEFRVCRFSLIVTVLGLLVFVYVAQGVEVLRSLGEESTYHVLRSGPVPAIRWTGIVVGALMWSLAAWYTCRVLLFFDFSTHQKTSRRPAGHWWALVEPWLREQLPRLLGVAPLLIMALGFWHASTTYDRQAHSDAPWWLRAYAVCCVVLAGLFYLFLIYRRRLFGLRPRGDADFASRQAGKRQLGDLESGTRIALAVMTVISLTLLLTFTLNPILFAGTVGTATVLLVAAACWVFWGSVGVYIFARFRVPVLTFAVLWAAFCSLFNDNHNVRLTKQPAKYQRQTVGEAFDTWHRNISQAYKAETHHPLFIVATEGGGIRAAYWTAAVLGKLQDDCAAEGRPNFADHVFAISGVSGGSLGAATFDAALAGDPNEPISKRMQAMLGEDFLAPVAAAMLYPDFAQRFIPVPFEFLDRGRWLELSWEQAGWRHLHNRCFSDNFNDLWKPPPTTAVRPSYLPALFLNGTTVESGQRIIASNLIIGNGFLDAIDISKKVSLQSDNDCDSPLSTAVHGSARFTYVSPAGLFRDGTHIVDGGYFENSGSTTAMEILRDVRAAIKKAGISDVVPHIISITNDPLSSPNGGIDLQRNSAVTKAEQSDHRPRSFLEDLLAPVWAMINTRDAHNSYAQLALREAIERQEKAPSLPPELDRDRSRYFYFGLSPTPIPLPLGWKLSGTSAREMNRQMEESCEEVDGKDNPKVFKEIRRQLKKVGEPDE